MSAREKDQADFDLETFVDLFDTAMSSDNPTVQRALKNLLMIAAIVNAENTNAGLQQGPLRRLVEDQKNIVRRLQDLENNGALHKQFGPIPPSSPSMPYGPVPLNPFVWPSTGTGSPPPNQIWCATNASSTGFDDQFISDPQAKYATLLDKLETRN